MAVSLIVLFGALTRIGAHAMQDGAPRARSVEALFRAVQTEAARTGSATSMLLVLATFAAAWPALWLTLRVHRRPGATLFGPTGRINWTHFRIGLAISLALGAAAWLPILHTHGAAQFSVRPLDEWLPLMAVALPLIFVQCSAEELFFRGYLLQQIAARSWSILGWSILPSLLFGFAHHDPNGLFGLSWYHFVFGLVMAAVTSRTANLGAAIGLHFGINIVNLLVVSPERQLSGLALVTYPHGMDVRPALFTYIAVMFVGATVFMATMDLRFLRAWKAQKREAEAQGRPDADEPLPMTIVAPERRSRPRADGGEAEPLAAPPRGGPQRAAS